MPLDGFKMYFDPTKHKIRFIRTEDRRVLAFLLAYYYPNDPPGHPRQAQPFQLLAIFKERVRDAFVLERGRIALRDPQKLVNELMAFLLQLVTALPTQSNGIDVAALFLESILKNKLDVDTDVVAIISAMEAAVAGNKEPLAALIWNAIRSSPHLRTGGAARPTPV